MRFSVILVPDDDGVISVSVPALPGCVSMGQPHEEALAHVRAAISGWIETELSMGATIPNDTPAAVAAGLVEAIEIIDEMRAAGEVPPDRGYELSVATVDVPLPVPA